MKATRRHFLMGAIGATAAAVPVRRGNAAAENIVLGFMGIRGRGLDLIRAFSKRPDVEIAYLADVDSRLLSSRADEAEKATGRRPKTVQDFRRILDDQTVNAIVIATPDHWHALGSILACQAGKDVYVEKPTSHSIWESRKMVEAARKHQRVVQVGAQNRSAPYVKAAVEYVRSGKLGEVHFVRVLNSKPRGPIGALPDASTPAGVDYNMWLGPAPVRPFNENHFHAWNWFWSYSGGDIINDGVHQIDMARWCIARPYAKSVHASGGIHFLKDAQETPDTLAATWDFDGMTMVFEQTQWTPYLQKTPMSLRDRDVLPKWPFNGTRIEIYGSRQWMMLGRHSDGWEVYDGDGKTVAYEFGRQANAEHVGDFLECIRTRKRPNGDIEDLHLSTLLCHQANIAYRTGRTLSIDTKTEGFVDDAPANRLVKRAYRKPWVVPESV